MKSLSSKTYQCGVTIQGLTTLSGTVYLTGITNTASWDHVIVGTTAQGQIYTRTYAQIMSDITSGIGLSGYVPTSRTLTINGVSYDLTANRSWTITTPYVSKLQHQVKAGVAINKGQAVYVTSADGTNMIVGLASNASEATSSKTMGLLDATVSTNGFANVVTEGLLDGLDTSTAGAAGDPVWLGTGGNLIYGLANKPYAPAHLVFIGIVTRKNSNNGEIFVKVQNGFELNEIHDVDLKTNLPVNGELLGFNGTLWVNKTIAGWLGYTPVNASGTTNYISKFTGSTTLGNSQIFDNGTNVGIGTTSPIYKLHVSNNANGFISRFTGGASSDVNIGIFGYTGAFGSIGTESNHPLNIFTSGTDRMTISTSGNVGIGTTSPAYKLDVKGNLSVATMPTTNTVMAAFMNGATEGIEFGHTGSNGVYGITNANYIGSSYFVSGSFRSLAFVTSNAAQMVITTTGNVGIGTTSPSGKLSIVTSGTNDLLYLNSGVNTDFAYKIVSGSDDAFVLRRQHTTQGDLSIMSWTYSGKVGIGTTSPSDKLQVQNGNLSLYSNSYGNTGLIRHFGTDSLEKYQQGLTTGGDFYQYTFSGLNHIFYTNNGNERMRITSGGNILMNTVATPTTGGFTNTTLSVKQVADGLYGGGLHIEENATTSVAYFGFNGSVFNIGTSYRTTGNYRPIAFSTNGLERLRIDNAGNVGIGTTSPTYKLQLENGSQYIVGGLGAINSSPYTSANRLIFNNDYNDIARGPNKITLYDGSWLGGFGIHNNTMAYYSGGVHEWYLATNASNPASLMTLLANGNLGIGISPATRLNIYGVDPIFRMSTADNSMDIKYTTSGGGAAQRISIGAGASTEHLVVLNSGNVGIGTTSPSYKLHVEGTIYSPVYTSGSITINSGDFLFAADGGGDGFQMDYYNGQMYIGNNAGTSWHMVMQDNGNVGIGTTTPATLLDVNGVITATGGNSTNWNTAYGWGNHASASYVPQARTLTINGTTYDLSANRSWTIATTTPGGSDTQFQYNSSGTLAGASALIYNSTTNRVGINQASPGYDLDVNGQVRVQDKLRIGTGNGVVHMSSSATINASATTVVWAQTVSVGMCAFIEYYILNNNSLTDQRAGTIMVTWNQSGTPTIAHTETTTPDIGSTTSINFTSSLVGSDARINAVNSSANPYTIVMSYKYF
jgi:hypothetical protein